MNLAIALTATRYGATVANHVSVTSLLKSKDETGKEVLSGVTVKDELTGKSWKVPGKCVINATGPFTDTIRLMDDPSTKKICSPSSGVHIVLPGKLKPLIERGFNAEMGPFAMPLICGIHIFCFRLLQS